MKRICVFCGSRSGSHPAYIHAAQNLGQLLATRGITLIYGGGNVGLMGEVAEAALKHKGKVIGVIPQALVTKELAHNHLTDLHIVDSMHQRKALMAELADAFIALPGGFGTFEEICEIITWTQLGLQKKPCGFLNVEGFYDPFFALIQRAVSDGFIFAENASIAIKATDAEQLLAAFTNWQAPAVEKWLSKHES